MELDEFKKVLRDNNINSDKPINTEGYVVSLLNNLCWDRGIFDELGMRLVDEGGDSYIITDHYSSELNCSIIIDEDTPWLFNGAEELLNYLNDMVKKVNEIEARIKDKKEGE